MPRPMRRFRADTFASPETGTRRFIADLTDGRKVSLLASDLEVARAIAARVGLPAVREARAGERPGARTLTLRQWLGSRPMPERRG